MVSCNAGSHDSSAARLQRLEEVIIAQGSSLVAVHFQELGGQAKDMQLVQLLDDNLRQLSVRLGLAYSGLWANRDPALAFTGLGTAFFYRAHLPVLVLDRRLGQLVPLSSALQRVQPDMQFATFCQTEQFASPTGGRKGFVHVALQVDGVAISFVNLHLVADLDNERAAASSPSEYAQTRAATLKHLMERCDIPADTNAAIYAGDFNFRLDLKSLWADKGTAERDVMKPKLFRCEYVQAELSRKNGAALRRWDLELQRFNENGRAENLLLEQPIDFAPSYCMLDATEHQYDEKRCPAWTDRVLYNQKLANVATNFRYGSKSALCDHHMVYLAFDLLAENREITDVKSESAGSSTSLSTTKWLRIAMYVGLSVALVAWTWRKQKQ